MPGSLKINRVNLLNSLNSLLRLHLHSHAPYALRTPCPIAILLGSYPIQCTLQIFDVTEKESLVSFSLKILFILCLRSPCGCGEYRYEGNRSRRPSTSPSSSTLPSSRHPPRVEISQIAETGSASDIYRPCSLHDLVIAVKPLCCCFCIAMQHDRIAEREREEKGNHEES